MLYPILFYRTISQCTTLENTKTLYKHLSEKFVQKYFEHFQDTFNSKKLVLHWFNITGS